MKNHQVEYSIKGMCACFSVSRSGYYACGYSANLAAVLHNANTWMNELMPRLTNIKAVTVPSVSSSKSDRMTNRTIT